MSLISKGKKTLRHFYRKYFVNNDPLYCTLSSAQFIQKYIINDEIILQKNGVVFFFCLWVLVVQLKKYISLKRVAGKIALKSYENV